MPSLPSGKKVGIDFYLIELMIKDFQQSLTAEIPSPYIWCLNYKRTTDLYPYVLVTEFIRDDSAEIPEMAPGYTELPYPARTEYSGKSVAEVLSDGSEWSDEDKNAYRSFLEEEHVANDLKGMWLTLTQVKIEFTKPSQDRDRINFRLVDSSVLDQ